jgi:hypothetical protein
MEAHMSGQHHKIRAGWVYEPRPRCTCRGCGESKTLDRQLLVVAHRERIDGRVGIMRCTAKHGGPDFDDEDGD